MNNEMSPEALLLIAERFRVLSEPVRLRLINLLRDGELTVNELAERAELGQPNASKHLKTLSDAGILRRDQRGNTVFYQIADRSIFDLCEVVCDSLIERLKKQAGLFASV